MSEAEGDPETGAGCGGILVLTVLVLAMAFVLYAVSPEAFILVFWGGGAGLLFWQAKKVPSAPNPAPPPVPERGSEEEPQVTYVRDPSHPNRWVALRQSEWLRWTDTEDRDVS